MFGAPPAFRIVLIGNYAPEQCGLATFTTDLAESFARNIPDAQVKVVAMRETELDITGDSNLLCEVRRGHLSDYSEAAETINEFGADIVCVQHEYGIFGGRSGEHLLTILRNVRAPIVTTLHTILQKPTDDQRRVLDEILQLSERVVTMSERGREILHAVHGMHAAKIDMIPHGIPARPAESDAEIKAELGFADHQVLLTFGLLSPDKGIENVVKALPDVVRENPDLLYVVVGATHPNIRRQHGEAYRESLIATAEELGVRDHIRFVDAFVDLDELVRYICACDVYVTPYLKREQITSGTLAYAHGLGRPVVSTPYWYAEELLGEGRGLLVPARDPEAMATALRRVFGDEELRRDLRAKGLLAGEMMGWPAVARAYNAIFSRSIEQSKTRIASIMSPHPVHTSPLVLPRVALSHLRKMCDDTGLLQHAKYGVPNRHEGYCIDDNARMLIFAIDEEIDDLAELAIAFVEYAYSPEHRAFRNFMAYDRRWLETVGSDDSNGRTVWALGTALARSNNESVRSIAAELLPNAVDQIGEFEHLRSAAFATLGLSQLLPNDRYAGILKDVAARLKGEFRRNAEPGWIWFEDFLSYDNARLSEAAIRTGVAIEDEELVEIGMKSLDWITKLQLDRRGQFAPIGCNGFHCKGGERAWFDQQPLEAAASISASLAAYEVSSDVRLVQMAENAFAWFLGRNAVVSPVADVETGACRDGLSSEGVNKNMGAESTLAYLMALSELRRALPSQAAAIVDSPAIPTDAILGPAPKRDGKMA